MKKNNNVSKYTKVYFGILVSFLLVTSFITLVSASWVQNSISWFQKQVTWIPPQQVTNNSSCYVCPTNYSNVNVNNSQYLNGHPDTYFYPYSNPLNFINTSGGSGNPFDQVLNTTSNVTFNNINIPNYGGIYPSTNYNEHLGNSTNVFYQGYINEVYTSSIRLIDGSNRWDIANQNLYYPDGTLWIDNGNGGIINDPLGNPSVLYGDRILAGDWYLVGNLQLNNLTSDYIFGNGSQLTGVCLSNGTNCVSSGGMNYINIAMLNQSNTYSPNTIQDMRNGNITNVSNLCLNNGVTNCISSSVSGTQLYFNSTTNKNIVVQTNSSTAMTGGYIPYTTTNGYLISNSGLTYNGADFILTETSAPVFTRSLGISYNQPQSAIQIGTGGAGVGVVGGGPSFLMFGNDASGAKSFMGRLTAAWENATVGNETGSITFSVRANSADTTASTEVMRIKSNGNVGIGTTNPRAPLHLILNGVAGTPTITSGTSFVLQATGTTGSSSIMDIISGYTGNAGIYFGNNNSDYRGQIMYNNNLDSMSFATNRVTAMTINKSGQVSIGTTNANGMLNIYNGTSTAVELLTLQSVFGNPSGAKSITWRDGTNILGQIDVSYAAATGTTMHFGHLYNSGYQTTDLMSLSNTGNLNVFGNVTASYKSSDGTKGITDCYDSSLGGQVCTKNGIVTSIADDPSDKNLKSNVQNLSLNLSNYYKLNPVSFIWNSNYSTREGQKWFGMIAQDVAQVYPDVITNVSLLVNEEKKDYLGINYAGILGITIKKVQEQDLIIKNLTNQIAYIKASASNAKNFKDFQDLMAQM